jgi:hypothetical protein
LLSALDKNGVNVRQTLMEHLSLSKDQLEEALSKGQIDVSTYLGLIDQLTGAGTDAYSASTKAAHTTLGQLRSIWTEMKSAWSGAGRALDRFIIRPLADKVLPLLQTAVTWARKFWDGPDPTEQLYAETPDALKPAAEKDKITQRFEAQQQRKYDQEARAAQQQAEQEAGTLRRDFRNTRAAERWAGMSLEERRTSIGRNTGLGPDLTLAALDERILASEGFKNRAATAEQLAELRMLVTERKRFVELLKLEAAEREKLTKQEELLGKQEEQR